MTTSPISRARLNAHRSLRVTALGTEAAPTPCDWCGHDRARRLAGMTEARELDLARRHASYDASALTDGGCAHGDGWFDIIDRIFSAIEIGQPGGVRWVQIKEKCGKLRIYADGCTPETAALIDAAEAESVTVCDRCGAPGIHRWERRAATRCEAHRGPPRPPPLTEEEFAEYEARLLRILGDDPTKW